MPFGSEPVYDEQSRDNLKKKETSILNTGLLSISYFSGIDPEHKKLLMQCNGWRRSCGSGINHNICNGCVLITIAPFESHAVGAR
jgi:hypothetical protein